MTFIDPNQSFNGILSESDAEIVNFPGKYTSQKSPGFRKKLEFIIYEMFEGDDNLLNKVYQWIPSLNDATNIDNFLDYLDLAKKIRKEKHESQIDDSEYQDNLLALDVYTDMLQSIDINELWDAYDHYVLHTGDNSEEFVPARDSNNDKPFSPDKIIPLRTSIKHLSAKLPEVRFDNVPGLTDELKYWALEGLKSYLDDYDRLYEMGDSSNYADRYVYELVGIDEYSYREITFKFVYHLKDPDNKGVKAIEPRYPDSDEYTREVINYKSAKEAIQEIPVDDNLVYRGMSWEEWQVIRGRGFVQSKGGANLGGAQRGKTYFAKRPDTAYVYSAGFAPEMFQPGVNKPGVVIAVDKQGGIEGPNQEEAVSDTEYAFIEPIPISRIKHVWIVKPVKVLGEGKIEIICEFDYMMDENDEKHITELKRSRRGQTFSLSPRYQLIEYQGKY